MRRVALTFIFLLTISSFLPYISLSQGYVPTAVEISKEKVNVNGTVFYVHKVLQGQTLYSICAKYEVTQETLQKHNPTLKEGLRTGAVLYIPITFSTSTTATNIEELRKEKETEIQEDIRMRYKKHTVKWYETLNDIAAKYGVSKEAIAHLNNIDVNDKIKKRQKLLIPDKNYQSRVVTDADLVADPDLDTPETPVTEHNGTVSGNGNYVDPFLFYSSSHRSYKISIALPFHASRNTDDSNVRQLDFYSGALLALRDLQKDDRFKKYSLNVIDLDKYPSTRSMVGSGVLDRSELIIGPVVEDDLLTVSQYAKENRIPIISPLDPKTSTLLEGNPYFFLFPSILGNQSSHQIDKMVSEGGYMDKTYILIHEQGATRDSLEIVAAEMEMEKRGIGYKTFSYPLLKGRGIDVTLKHVLDTLGTNFVLVESESEAFVSDVMRNLNLIQNNTGCQITVFGQPRWKNFETIELEYFHLLNTHLSLQYYVDYNDSKTKDFVAGYWQIFKSDPTPYSFQGYDIMTFFLSALERYGREFPVYISQYRHQLLQSDVHFTSNPPYRGFENSATRDVVYLPDWKIICSQH